MGKNIKREREVSVLTNQCVGVIFPQRKSHNGQSKHRVLKAFECQLFEGGKRLIRKSKKTSTKKNEQRLSPSRGGIDQLTKSAFGALFAQWGPGNQT